MNWPTILIAAAIAAAIAVIIIKIIRGKGKLGCDEGCSGCPMEDQCSKKH